MCSLAGHMWRVLDAIAGAACELALGTLARARRAAVCCCRRRGPSGGGAAKVFTEDPPASQREIAIKERARRMMNESGALHARRRR